MYKHPIVQRMAMIFIHGGKTAEAQEILQGVSDICDQNNALVDEFNRLNNMTAQELLDKVRDVRVNEVAKLLADGKDPPPMLRSELPIIVPEIITMNEALMKVEVATMSAEVAKDAAIKFVKIKEYLEEFHPEVLKIFWGWFETENTIYGGSSGSAEAPTFREIQLEDIPTLDETKVKPVQVFDKDNKEVEPTPVNGGA